MQKSIPDPEGQQVHTGQKKQTKNGSRANRGQLNQAIGAARHHDLGTSLHGHNDIAPDHVFPIFRLLLTNSE